MHTPSYCFRSLGKVFYWRMRVPKELQPILKKTGFKKSLRTKDKITALRLCRQYVATAEQTFASLRLKLFKAEFVGNNSNIPFEQLSLFHDIGNSSDNQAAELPPQKDNNELSPREFEKMMALKKAA